MNAMSPTEVRRCMDRMTPAQLVAMTSDDLALVPVGTLRGLQRRGYARFVDLTFWAFTPLGRRLRAGMFKHYEQREREHAAAMAGAT